jgi:hypothetical protein
MTGCARADYLHADDAEVPPTRSITIAVQVAGRSGGDASEAIVTAMKGPRRGTTKASALVAAVLATILAGCGQQTTSANTNTNTNTTPLTASDASTSSTSSVATREASTTARTPGRRSSGAGRKSERGLAYSTASAQIVQPQPASGSCHAIGAGLYSRPDPRCTPGALNPAVTQANIRQTICRPGWTDTIRPPESVTEPEKAASMAAYGDAGPISSYEYDHFVPLELGGAVNDPRNLWPEPGASPNPKDAVEDALNRKVCNGQMTLAQAQRAIATNWIALAVPTSEPAPNGRTSTSTTTPTSAGSAASAKCTVSVSYNDRYHDYDVHVHSNQPSQTVTVTDAGGRTATWHTDASGYADVYLHAGSDASGDTITARVGNASCQGTL